LRKAGFVRRFRLALIPIGAIVVAALSHGLGPPGKADTAAPASGSQATTVYPAEQPALPADAVAIVPAGSTDTDRKIVFWQDRIAANPGSDVQYQYLGELFSLKGRETGDVGQYARAAEAFERALELYPGNAAARSGLAVTHLTLHRWHDAIEEATQILQADRRALGAVAVIGDASLEIGALDTARAAYETLRERADAPGVQARLARLAFLEGDTYGAIEILDAAANAAAELNRSSEEQAFYRYSAGEYRFSHGDVVGAKRDFDTALAILPGYYLALAGRGRVAFAEGDLDGAIERYQAAVAIIPRPELLAFLGDLYALKGEPSAAERQYAAVDFIAELGDVQAEVGNREVALFQASHGRDTAHAVRLATTELDTRKDIYGYDALAWALFQAGQPAKALEPAMQSISLGTQDPKLLYHAGMIEIAVGRVSAGRAHLEAALALNPAFDPLGAAAARAALAD
jgi:tetratricopeptide (TPR) repeat protein